jgi:hypothetical protein
MSPGTNSRVFHPLIATQTACTVAVLVLALAFGSEFIRRRLDLPVGAPEQVRFVDVTTAVPYSERVALTQQLLATADELERLEGVEQAGLTSEVPFDDVSSERWVALRGTPNIRLLVQRRTVSDGFFQVLPHRILRGRTFLGADALGSEPVAVLNRRLAVMLGIEGRELGQLVESDDQVSRVVGVLADVPDVQNGELVVRAEFYRPITQVPTRSAVILLRLAGGQRAAPEVVNTVERLLPRHKVERTGSLANLRARGGISSRYYFAVAIVVAVAGMLLAVGGVIAASIINMSLRSGETAIRVALGASATRVASECARTAGLWALAGCVAGAASGLGVIEILRGILSLARPPLTPVVVSMGMMVCLVWLSAFMTSAYIAWGNQSGYLNRSRIY